MTLQQLHDKAKRLQERIAPDRRDPQYRIKRLQTLLDQQHHDLEMHRAERERHKQEVKRIQVERRQTLEAQRKNKLEAERKERDFQFVLPSRNGGPPEIVHR